MKRRWTEEEAWAWYTARPWISGFNFIPSGSMTGSLWLFQEYGHKEAFRDAAREIALAAELGFNSIRMVLPFEVYRQEKEAFFIHMDEFLELLWEYDITLMPVLFGDCCVPREKYRAPRLGPQPEPVPGYFGGSPVTPFDDSTQSGESIGYSITDDPENRPVIEEYIKELASRYGQDPRILMWNVWNEAGNSGRLSRSLPMMEAVFTWLREEDVMQPLTADVWGAGADNPYGWLKKPGIYAEIEEHSIALSDIITFHYYGDYTHSRQYVEFLRRFNRPPINTEWLHRPFRSLIQTHLPMWKKEGVGSYFFGFVNGKSQFNYVWEFIKNLPDIDTFLWMHDIFHEDFRPYDREEIEVIRECNRDKTLPENIGRMKRS